VGHIRSTELPGRKIKADRALVLGVIKKNYEAHKTAYAEAYAGYKIEIREKVEKAREAVAAQLTDILAKVDAADFDKGDRPPASPIVHYMFALNVPTCHAEDYEVVITALEYETDATIEMTQQEVEAFVMDRWAWTNEFRAVNSAYAGKAAFAAGR
jgi:hypothetical protein